jgi:SSS family solute:Na+ symporter
MVSGLLVPTLMAYFSKDPDAVAASASMLGGGGFTLVAILSKLPLPFGLEATVFGIAIAVVLYALVYFFRRSYVR